MATQQAIRRGILQSFDNNTYTATVLIVEATNYVLSSVPIATSVDGTSAISGANCAVLFFDESNHADAVIIAVYGQTPAPPPGRVTLLTTPELEVNGVVINSGITQTFTAGASIPNGALGIVYRMTMNTPTTGAFVYAGPHGATLSKYVELDNPGVAGAFADISGILPIDASGKFDIQANIGNCTVTLYSLGYVI